MSTGWPHAAFFEAARAAKLDAASARLVHEGHCACFVVPEQQLFVRVGRPGTEAQAINAIRFARACAGLLPVVPPGALPCGQPVITFAGPVTAWPLLQPTDTPVDFGWLGETLRRLHDHPPPAGLRHQQTDPSVIRARLERYRSSSYADSIVIGECERLIADIEALRSEVLPSLRLGLIHGDAYPANIVDTGSGPVLVDYDAAGIGPRYWDLAPTVVAHRRFGLPEDAVEHMLSAYGEDPRDDPALWAVVRIREWGAITYLLDLAGTSAVYSEELLHRLDSRRRATPWRTLDELRRAEEHATRQARPWQRGMPVTGAPGTRTRPQYFR
jgi:hypothetical protein